MPKIKVYTKPGCQPCRMTKRQLDKMGVEYVTVDISTDDDAQDYIVNTLKQKSVPVVEFLDGAEEPFSGYRPDRLKQLAASA